MQTSEINSVNEANLVEGSWEFSEKSHEFVAFWERKTKKNANKNKAQINTSATNKQTLRKLVKLGKNANKPKLGV